MYISVSRGKRELGVNCTRHLERIQLATVSVIGLGKIGLTLAVQIASQGNHQVIGCDIDNRVVSKVNAGVAPFEGEPQLAELLTQAVKENQLRAVEVTSNAVEQSQIVVIVVPLVVDGNGDPEWRNIDEVSQIVGASMAPGTLVVYETTLPVGTTRDRFGSILQEASSFVPERDFFLAYSPERVFSGRVFENFRNYPKLVGGVGPVSLERAVDFYESSITFDNRSDLSRPNGVWPLGSTEAAELAKLAETTFRDVNIGLANQFAIFAEDRGLDVYSIIEACNSQPFSMIHQPGVAVGGHCIPVYPHFYLMGDPDATIVKEARTANLSMPRHAVDKISEELGSLEGLRVVVLGLAYRGGVKESAFSGAFELVKELTTRGANASVHDPLYSHEEVKNLGLAPHSLGAHVDVAILQTNHESYLHLKDSDLPSCRLIIDGRNFLLPELTNKIQTLRLGVGKIN